jgi:hypothetical protein
VEPPGRSARVPKVIIDPGDGYATPGSWRCASQEYNTGPWEAVSPRNDQS